MATTGINPDGKEGRMRMMQEAMVERPKENG